MGETLEVENIEGVGTRSYRVLQAPRRTWLLPWVAWGHCRGCEQRSDVIRHTGCQGCSGRCANTDTWGQWQK